MMFAGCQKDFDGILNAEIEGYNGGNGKVYIDNMFVCWHDGDEIMLNWTTKSVNIETSTRTAIIGAGGLSAPYTAAYPAKYAEGGSLVLNLENTQMYRTKERPHSNTKVQVIDVPMIAYAAEGQNTLTFKNAGALVEVTVNNPESSDIILKNI